MTHHRRPGGTFRGAAEKGERGTEAVEAQGRGLRVRRIGSAAAKASGTTAPRGGINVGVSGWRDAAAAAHSLGQ